MSVFAVITETIALRRAYDCEHDWRPVEGIGGREPEEQCALCAVIATVSGKENLRMMAENFHRLRRRP